MNCMAHFVLLLLVCRCGQASLSSSGKMLRLKIQECLTDSHAVHLAQTQSVFDCVGIALRQVGLLVAQFNSDTRQCRLFRYIDVCHLIIGFDAANDRTPLPCAAFANARAAHFITLSRKLMLGVGSKLRAAWVMSEDEEFSRSNLVCGQTKQWLSEGVEWSSEGARFDGVSSKMWLENVDYANLRQGLTWLIRVRREMRVAPLLETHGTCDPGSVTISLWDGFSEEAGLFFLRNAHSAFYISYRTDPSTSNFDPNFFMEFGITSASPNPSDRTFFSNNRFVPKSLVYFANSFTLSNPAHFTCLTLGFRPGNSVMLRGTVQSVAIMNDTMTEAEIRSFFDLVR